MADKKKAAPPPTSSGPSIGTLWLIIGVVAFLIFFFGFREPFNPTFLNLEYFFGQIAGGVSGVVDYFNGGELPLKLKVIVLFICVLLIVLNIYLIVRLFELEKEHEGHAYHATDHAEEKPADHGLGQVGEIWNTLTEKLDDSSPKEKPGLMRWDVVTDYISSQSESDWRLAIIEADSLLDTVIDNAGYQGENLGERLKNAGVGAFKTYQDAWEAHKVRNRIAHDGAGFKISYRDAKRTISQYENVFREFEYI